MATQLTEKPKRAEDHDAQVDTDERPFLDHIIELRERLLKALLAVLVLFFPLYYYANNIYEWVAAPLMANLPTGSGMIATEVASPFLTPFKLSMYAAFFLAMPVILHQMWAFVSPDSICARNASRCRCWYRACCSTTSAWRSRITWYFPLVFKFFAGVTPVGVTMMTDINHYLEFVLGLFFAFGFTFEIPIATFLIVSTGLTTTKSLTDKRPYVIVGCFVVGMILTPGPDVISQIMLAVPMWILFELGVFFARMAERNTQSTEVAEAAEAKD